MLVVWTGENRPVEARKVIVAETAATPHPQFSFVLFYPVVFQ
jgi:hypothetical protein